MSFLGLKERWGEWGCFFASAAQSFPCEGNTDRGKGDT